MIIDAQNVAGVIARLTAWGKKCAASGRMDDAKLLAGVILVLQSADLPDAPLADRVSVARAAIMRHAGGKLPAAGSTVCPICGNSLGYSIAANGHVHGQCLTPDCVRWME